MGCNGRTLLRWTASYLPRQKPCKRGPNVTWQHQSGGKERDIHSHLYEVDLFHAKIHRFQATPYKNMEESQLHSITLIPLTGQKYYTSFVKFSAGYAGVQRKKNGGHGAIKFLWRIAGVMAEYGIRCAHIWRHCTNDKQPYWSLDHLLQLEILHDLPPTQNIEMEVIDKSGGNQHGNSSKFSISTSRIWNTQLVWHG